ncbi:MAG: hypothetical protein ACLUE4_06240 [Acutalibacteraceae bacterium]
MQTRTITVDYAHPRGYDVGYRAENNFTLLALPIPAELEGADSYRVYFESTVGEYLQTGLLTPVDGYVAVKITSDVVPEPGNMAAQLVAFADGEIVGYAPMITGSAKVSIPDGTERLSHSLAAEIALNTTARHSHDNKPVIDLLTADDTGTLLYDGKVIGGGGSTGSELFIVNVQAQSGADEYTITSHNKTYEQIDAAYKAGKQVLIAFTVTNENNTFLIPLGIATETDYEFLVFANAVFYVYVDNTDTWDCYVEPLEADSIKAKISADSSAQSLSLQTILNSLVYPAVEKAHEHSNKSVLDGLSDSNGVLYYNNKPIIAQKISEGPYITLADNTEYRLTDVTTLKLSYPVGDFESWMRLNFAASGNITVTLPAGTGYIGTAPDFKNGETWELSFKDKILAAQKVGEGT